MRAFTARFVEWRCHLCNIWCGNEGGLLFGIICEVCREVTCLSCTAEYRLAKSALPRWRRWLNLVPPTGICKRCAARSEKGKRPDVNTELAGGLQP